MRPAFDTGLLRASRGVPISSVLPGRDVAAGAAPESFEMAPAWHALANPMFGSEEDPGVTAFLWVRWPDVVSVILRYERLATHQTRGFAEPDESLLGFTPLNYESALAHEKSRGFKPLLTASYRFADGAHVYSALEGRDRNFYFEAANPEATDAPIAVMFKLR